MFTPERGRAIVPFQLGPMLLAILLVGGGAPPDVWAQEARPRFGSATAIVVDDFERYDVAQLAGRWVRADSKKVIVVGSAAEPGQGA